MYNIMYYICYIRKLYRELEHMLNLDNILFCENCKGTVFKIKVFFITI